MNSHNQQDLVKQVWSFARMQSIFSGILVCAFTFTGFIMINNESNETSVKPVSQIVTNADAGLPEEEKLMTPQTETEAHNDIRQANNQLALQEENEQDKNTKHPDKNVLTARTAVLESENQPVIAGFTASCEAGIVNISWLTVGLDDSNFNLEFSSDNQTFELITEPLEMTVTDNAVRVVIPGNHSDKQFYRLRKEVGKKSFRYSDVVMVSCGQETASHEPAIDVFPSGRGSYKVLINSGSEDHFSIVLTDLNENELVSDEFDVMPGANEFIFRSGVMPKGDYNLKVTNGEFVSQKKVAIK